MKCFRFVLNMSEPVIPMPLGKNITISKDGIILYVKDLGASVIDALPQWVFGICVILIGWKLSHKLVYILERILTRRDTEPGLQTFLRSFSSALIKTCFVIIGAGIMGLNTAGLVTILGAAGLAIGLALQGALSNFAGGVLILLFKPFKVGDVIEAQNQSGEVKEIQIFNTIILTPNYKTVILANGPLSNGTVINHSRAGQLRTDLVFYFPIHSNFDTITDLALQYLNAQSIVLKQPLPQVYFGKIIDGQVLLHVKVFVKAGTINEDESVLMNGLLHVFQTQGLQFGMPQRIVHSEKS